MASYRLYTGITHALIGIIEADNDDEAIKAVNLRLEKVDVELWRGGELVAVIPKAGKFLRKLH